jgi:transposase
MIPGIDYETGFTRKGVVMESYYMGIDVSKGYADFVILDATKNVAEPNFQLDDTFSSHCKLFEILKRFFDHHSESVLFTAVESTGGYENNWLHSLVGFQGSLNIKSSRLNPLGVQANSRASLRRVITDKTSARDVAEYLIAHPEKVTYQQEDSLAGLRRQWGFVRLLVKQKTQILNQLGSLLYTANPELITYCKSGLPTWLLKLLKQYPTAAKLAKAKASSVARIPYVTAGRAKELIDQAKKSVASVADETTEKLIMVMAEQIIRMEETIRIQTQQMAQQCTIPEVALLKTFPGISDVSAIGLMLEIQSVKRFSSVKKLAAFFGLHPAFKTSGDGTSSVRMSKQGRKESRKILFMVALVSLTANPHIRKIFEEHTEKGMKKMAAIGLCMHKILRIIYGMLKNNQAYDSQVDQKNRENSTVRRSTHNTKNANRRYEMFDQQAPISRRQSNKRKEWKQSQGDNITKCGIGVPIPSVA